MMNSEVGFGRKVLSVFEKYGINFEHMPSGIDTMTVFVHQSEFEAYEQSVVAGIHRVAEPDTIELRVRSGTDRSGRQRYALQQRHCRPYLLRTGTCKSQCKDDRSGIQ